jgi:hypothetical protein
MLLLGREKVLGRIKAGLTFDAWVLLLFVAVSGLVLKVGRRYIKPFKERKWKAIRFVVKRQPLNKLYKSGDFSRTSPSFSAIGWIGITFRTLTLLFLAQDIKGSE